MVGRQGWILGARLMLGLYLHIPVCAAICNYCNFNRGLLDEAVKRRYVDALIAEIRACAEPAATANEPSTSKVRDCLPRLTSTRAPSRDTKAVLIYGPDRGLVSERAAAFAKRTGLPLDRPEHL